MMLSTFQTWFHLMLFVTAGRRDAYIRFMAPGGRLAKEFHIMPQTFVLPHEFTLFVAAFTASGSGSGYKLVFECTLLQQCLCLQVRFCPYHAKVVLRPMIMIRRQLPPVAFRVINFRRDVGIETS